MSVSQVGTPAAPAQTTSGTGTITVTGAWGTGQNRTANNRLVAIVTAFGSSSAAATAEAAGTTGWTKTQEIVATNSVSAIWEKVAAGSDAAPAFTSSIAGTSIRTRVTCTLHELNDSGGGTPSSDTAGTNSGTTGALTTTTTGNVAGSGEYALSVENIGSGSSSTTNSWSSLGSFTDEFDDGGASAFSHFIIGKLSSPTSGATLSFAPGFTATVAHSTGIVVVYKGTAGVAATIQHPASRERPAFARRKTHHSGTMVPSVPPPMAKPAARARAVGLRTIRPVARPIVVAAAPVVSLAPMPARPRTPTGYVRPVRHMLSPVHPQIVLVGQTGVAGVSTGSPATITRTTVAGNTLIIAGHLYDLDNGAFVAPTSITDTAGNKWYVSVNAAQSSLTAQNPPLSSTIDPADGASAHVADFVAWSVKAASVTSVTINWEGGVTTFQRIALTEWSGIDHYVTSWAGGSTSSVPTLTGGPLGIPDTGCLVIGTVDFNNTSQTNPSGYIIFTSSGGNVGYVLPAPVGTYSPLFTGTASSNCNGALAVFAAQPPAASQAVLQQLRIKAPGIYVRPVRRASAVPAIAQVVAAPARSASPNRVRWLGWLSRRPGGQQSLPVAAVVVPPARSPALNRARWLGWLSRRPAAQLAPQMPIIRQQQPQKAHWIGWPYRRSGSQVPSQLQVSGPPPARYPSPNRVKWFHLRQRRPGTQLTSQLQVSGPNPARHQIPQKVRWLGSLSRRPAAQIAPPAALVRQQQPQKVRWLGWIARRPGSQLPSQARVSGPLPALGRPSRLAGRLVSYRPVRAIVAPWIGRALAGNPVRARTAAPTGRRPAGFVAAPPVAPAIVPKPGRSPVARLAAYRWKRQGQLNIFGAPPPAAVFVRAGRSPVARLLGYRWRRAPQFKITGAPPPVPSPLVQSGGKPRLGGLVLRRRGVVVMPIRPVPATGSRARLAGIVQRRRPWLTAPLRAVGGVRIERPGMAIPKRSSASLAPPTAAPAAPATLPGSRRAGRPGATVRRTASPGMPITVAAAPVVPVAKAQTGSRARTGAVIYRRIMRLPVVVKPVPVIPAQGGSRARVGAVLLRRISRLPQPMNAPPQPRRPTRPVLAYRRPSVPTVLTAKVKAPPAATGSRNRWVGFFRFLRKLQRNIFGAPPPTNFPGKVTITNRQVNFAIVTDSSSSVTIANRAIGSVAISDASVGSVTVTNEPAGQVSIGNELP